MIKQGVSFLELFLTYHASQNVMVIFRMARGGPLQRQGNLNYNCDYEHMKILIQNVCKGFHTSKFDKFGMAKVTAWTRLVMAQVEAITYEQSFLVEVQSAAMDIIYTSMYRSHKLERNGFTRTRRINYLLGMLLLSYRF